MSLPRIRSLAAALLLAAAAGPALATTAHTPSAQVPGVYHQQIGTLQVTALFDGTVALGRMGTPYDDLRGKTNAIADTNLSPVGDTIKNAKADYTDKTDNTVAYVSPAFNGFSAAVAVSLGENKTTGVVGASPVNDAEASAWVRASSAACRQRASGSTIMTMPGPPPNGRSSSRRYWPSAKSRGFQKHSSTCPDSNARRLMPLCRNGVNSSGNRVRMSKRMARPALNSRLASRP